MKLCYTIFKGEFYVFASSNKSYSSRFAVHGWESSYHYSIHDQYSNKRYQKTVQQILDLEKVGCQLIRVAILDMDDASAIQEIKKEIHIPIIADIHFDYRLALKAIESGADKIRINPGNIGDKNHLLAIIEACKKAHIPIRIGVNSGSIEKDLLHQYGSSVKWP